MELNNASQNLHGAGQDRINYFAETDFRNKKIRFGIKAKDRTRHVYVIGKTGMGKSTMLENMAVQDIENGDGMAFIDPHGGTAEKLLDYIPEARVKDTVYFAPFDTDHPISFNVMEDVGVDKRHLVANGLMNAFKKIWVDAWSARMEYILNNVLLALLEYPDSTLLGVNRMLSDKDYRNLVVKNVSDASVRAFWTDEFAKYGQNYMQEAGAAIQNKVGQFVSNPLIRNIIGQPKSSFDVRKIMDDKKILIMNLSKGRMGIENSALLGNMLVTKIYLGAMSRADASPAELQKLPNFYFYVDEFQSFANESFADILSEARKYKLNLTIAHQYVNQMPEEVRDAVFGNVGTMVTFRIGPEDAELFEKEFAPLFVAEDFVNLGFAQIYLRLMVDGIGSKPFSATTLPPLTPEEISLKDRIIETSRKNYASPRAGVEAVIGKWYEPVVPPKPPRERVEKGERGKGEDTGEFLTERRERPPRSPAGERKPNSRMEWRAPSNPSGQGENESRAPAERPRGEFRARREEQPPRVPQTPIRPSPPPLAPTPVSLKELRPDRNRGPSRNSAALKEALQAALKDRVSPAPANQNKSAGINGLKEESKKWAEMKKEGQTPSAPKEVPEDVLRKLLGE